MNAIAALLATAAATAGTIKVARIVRRELAARRGQSWLKKRRSGRQDGSVLDLKQNADGVYGLSENR